MKIDCGQQEEKFSSVSPWKRKRPGPKSRGESMIRQHAFQGKFDRYVDVNKDLDIDTKRAALKASPAVVSLVSYKGGNKMFAGSGTIIGSEEVNGTYTSTVVTSSTLLGSSSESNAIQDDIKVKVYLFDGRLLEGCVSGYDFHFNIATIDMTSDEALPVATLRPVDDSISIYPSEVTCPKDNEGGSKSFQLRCHSNLFKLRPGDHVVAIGRVCGKTHALMAAPGKFSFDSCKFDCRELLKSTCIISKMRKSKSGISLGKPLLRSTVLSNKSKEYVQEQSGFGGPLINRYGEVIGVNFYGNICTPFLPVNIVSKCLRRFKKSRKPRRPWLGLELTNLCTASIGKLEKVIVKFNISKGVLVDKVIKGSPAEQAGILHGDVIVQCGQKEVQSFLEFFDIVWKMVGKTLEVVVIREASAAPLILKVFVDETSPDKLNRWPVPGT